MTLVLWWFSDLWDGMSGEGRVIATIAIMNFLLSLTDRVLDKFKDKVWSQEAHRYVDGVQTVLSWLMMNRRGKK